MRPCKYSTWTSPLRAERASTERDSREEVTTVAFPIGGVPWARGKGAALFAVDRVGRFAVGAAAPLRAPLRAPLERLLVFFRCETCRAVRTCPVRMKIWCAMASLRPSSFFPGTKICLASEEGYSWTPSRNAASTGGGHTRLGGAFNEEMVNARNNTSAK
jgi:hypothetical protein